MTPLEALRASKGNTTNEKTLTPLEQLRLENKPKPTLGSKVLKVGKEVAKSVIRDLARTGGTIIDPLEKKLFGEMTGQQSVVGDVSGYGMRKGDTPEQRKKDILGGALTTASYVVGGPATKSVLKGSSPVVKAGVEGLVSGMAQGAGSALSADKSTKGVITDTLIGGGLGLGLGAGGAKLFGSKTPKPISSASSVLDNAPVQAGLNVTEDVVPMIQQTIKPDSVQVRQAADVADKLGFNFNKATQIIEEANKLQGEQGWYSVSDIEEIAKKYTPDKPPTVVKPVNAPTPITNIKDFNKINNPQQIVDKPTINQQQPVDFIKPTQTQYNILNDLKNDNPRDFVRKTDDEIITIFNQKLKDNTILDVIINGDMSSGLPRPAAYRLYNQYLDTLNTPEAAQMAKRLSFYKGEIISETGQNLSSARLGTKDSTAEMLEYISRKRAEVVTNKNTKTINQEIDNLIKQVDTEIKSQNVPISTKIIKEILETIKC